MPKNIGNYIVDFFCSELGIVIEIDGSSHDSKGKYDEKRESFLNKLGLKVIHITDSDVKERTYEVVMMLERYTALHV